MKDSEIKKTLKELLYSKWKNERSWDDKVAFLKSEIIKLDEAHGFDASKSKVKADWRDEELRLVLNTHPTKENILILAKAFKRSTGSIEQIFAWSNYTLKELEEHQPNHSLARRLIALRESLGVKSLYRPKPKT